MDDANEGIVERAAQGRTISEKILSRAAGRPLVAGDIAICTPDLAMGTDGSIPMALDYLAQIAGHGSGAHQPEPAPRDASRIVFALDHYGEASGERALALQERARVYGRTHGITVYERDEGIGHQRILETRTARPGMLGVGADSHSTSWGAVNLFATGIGSSDLAGVLYCGQLWLKVPPTIRIGFEGRLRGAAAAKDVALWIARRLGADGANYAVLEFSGPGVATLDIDDRIVLSNMAVEVGAKAGIFAFDEITARWFDDTGSPLRGPVPREPMFRGPPAPVAADADAVYAATISIDLGEIVPQIAAPHRVDNVVDALSVEPTPIDMVYLGTCTGGRVKDYREALDEIERGGGIAQGVRVIVTPASASVRDELATSGMLARFEAIGAEIQPPGCGSCCGTCGTAPSDGERVVSSANRNFKGRMGNASASIWLASPRTAARAAVRGKIG